MKEGAACVGPGSLDWPQPCLNVHCSVRHSTPQYRTFILCYPHAGYLIGLGDRHCQNILLDCDTAECVHIDLGIAFEQGRFLPTPEQVPFRLTRDLIDGMGAAG